MNIKFYIRNIIIIALVLSFNQVYSQNSKIDIKKDSTIIEQAQSYKGDTEFIIDFTSNYIWRDYLYGFAAIQPSVDYTFGESGFALNVWSSFGVDYYTNDLEVVSSLTYSFNIKKVSFSAGGGYYTAPIDTGSIGNTNFLEAMISCGFPLVLFSPNLEIYYDFNGSVYMSLSLEQTLFKIKKQEINMDGSVGYRERSDDNDNGIRDLNIGLSVPFEFKYFGISPFTKLSHIPQMDNTYFQAGVYVSFH